jgi:hypothetical protein
MKEYHKIQSVYKRFQTEHKDKPNYSKEKRGKFVFGEYTCKEFEYLKNNIWVGTEKIDGTNIRVDWITSPLEDTIEFGGRTDNAQIPTFLYKKLQELFPVEKFKELYPETSMTLYGEGFGAKIQKGSNYIPDGVGFILFDVLIKNYWLKRAGIEGIAQSLNIPVVPIVFEATLKDAEQMCEKGFNSIYGNFKAEGLVLKPKTDLFSRNGNRIITKLKYKDFD